MCVHQARTGNLSYQCVCWYELTFYTVCQFAAEIYFPPFCCGGFRLNIIFIIIAIIIAGLRWLRWAHAHSRHSKRCRLFSPLLGWSDVGTSMSIKTKQMLTSLES